MKFISLLLGFTFVVAFNYGHSQQVHGKVIDNHGNPIKGVNIIIKSTPIGTVSGRDGSFKIDLDYKYGTLVATLIGYKKLEIEIDSKNISEKKFLEITLIPNEKRFKRLKSFCRIDSLLIN